MSLTSASSFDTCQKPAPRVLVLDDDALFLRILGHVFGQLGCAVELVEMGDQALEQVTNQSWDLVVLDQHVPSVLGADPVPRVQAAAETRGVPVWACTSLCNTMEWDALRAQGYNHILAKPISRDAVAGGLRSLAISRAIRNSTTI